MAALKFDEEVCAACPTADCLQKCQYQTFENHEAHQEMMKVVNGEDSRVLHDCMTCYACEEYCPRGNHPYYLICERREEKGMFTAPRPITNQWINMTQMQGKQMVGKVEETAVSSCFIPALAGLASGADLQGRGFSHGLRRGIHVPCRPHAFRQDVGGQREASKGHREFQSVGGERGPLSPR